MAAPEAQAASAAADSKKQILKSTGVLGFSQLIVIIVGIARVKVLAVLLGATGVGIAGLYQNTIDLIRAATGLGIGASGVRDIATSAATGDQQKLSGSIKVLHFWSWLTGILGMLVAILFSRQLSLWAFDSPDYAWGIAVLSIAILFSSLSEAQSALLQGVRKIRAMAAARVAAAVAGLLGSVVIYYIWGVRGIVPAVLFVAVVGWVWNWFYTRSIITVPVAMAPKQVFRRGKAMVVLGIYLTLGSVLGKGVMYLVRSFLVHEGGLESVGYFVAAWSISYMYLSAVFNAMVGDYFPRLSAVQNDHPQMARLVNQQAEVAILIVAPIVTLMVSLIEIVVRVFYSKEFGTTAQILNWQLLGDFFKALSWPMGFILIAKGKGRIFLLMEFAWSAVYVLGVYVLWPHMGIAATGVSFLTAYAIYTGILVWVSRRLINFRLSPLVLRHVAVFLPLLLLAFLAQQFLGRFYGPLAGSIAAVFAAFYSFHWLKDILPLHKLASRLGFRKTR